MGDVFVSFEMFILSNVSKTHAYYLWNHKKIKNHR